MDTLLSVATQLALAQKRQGLSDVALASATGVSRQTINRIMRGRANFSASTLLSLAETLQLTVLIVPKDAGQAFQVHSRYGEVHDAPSVAGVIDTIKDL
jgi:transcriptional regulator with XRE-family HTH domain